MSLAMRAWMVWSISPWRLVVEFDDRITPRGCAIELELVLGAHGVRQATWRLEDGRPLRAAAVGQA